MFDSILTGVTLKDGPWGGFAEDGVLTPEEIIGLYRDYAQSQIDQFQRVIQAKDEDFRIVRYANMADTDGDVVQEGKKDD